MTLEVLGWPLAAALVLVADLALTGMLHVDGLADAADGLLPHHRDTARRLEVMAAPNVGAFGVAVVVFALQLLPQSAYLRVGPDGFTVCTLFRAHSCRWSDVGPFKVVRMGPKNMVGFSFSDRYRGPHHLARLNTNLVGAEAAVAVDGTWNIRMEELAAVLNRYRERYGAV